MYKQNLMINIITSILGIVLGLLLCFSDAEEFLRFIFAGVAIYLFLLAIPSLILVSKEDNKNEKTRIYVIAFTLIAIGAILLIYPTMIATIIGGALLLVIPLYNIISSNNKKEMFKKELVKLTLGIVLILCGVGSVVQVMLYIIGGIVIALSIAYLIYNLVIILKIKSKEKKEREENEVIDV